MDGGLMNAIKRRWQPTNGRKQITHPAISWPFIWFPRSKREYEKEIGDGLSSSVIMAPISFIMRVFTEAEPMVWRKEDMQAEPNHPLLEKLAEPNDFYDGTNLWESTVLSYSLNGNGYWQAVRMRNRAIAELWYTPHNIITPRWPDTGNVYISHYEYRVGVEPVKLPVDNVLHFRNGINPRNTRKGISPLDSVLREVYTDEEASNYTASMLTNMGVLPVILSPATGEMIAETEDIDKIKKDFKAKTTGDKRGDPIVMTGPTKVDKLAFSPQELNLGNVRDISEERVCAALGIPAAVVGFGTGLQQTKVGATMREMIKLAWVTGIIPVQRKLARQITRQLLPEFEPNPKRFVFGFDRSKVEALQESEAEKAERIARMVTAGVITRAQAQRELGFDVDPEAEVYLQAITTIERRAGEPAPEPVLPAPAQE